jgi:hypothetical protein
MYLQDERKIIWRDNHLDPRVILLNSFLNLGLLKQFAGKALKLIMKKMKSSEVTVNRQPVPMINRNVYEQDSKNIQL